MTRLHSHRGAARSSQRTMTFTGWRVEEDGRIGVQNFDCSRRAAFNSERPTPNAQRPLNAAKIARTFENRSPRIGRWALDVGRWALNAFPSPHTPPVEFA